MGKLTALKVHNAKPGTHGDGAGLYLRVKPSGARSWVLRVQVQGRREDIGLGSVAQLSLAEAREEAAKLRKAAKRGLNARAERDREKLVVPTFAEAMKATHAELSKGWAAKTADAFTSSLERHILPKLGTHRVDVIDAAALQGALAVVWTEKPALAKKLRVRTMQILAFARAKGWRSAPLPDGRELRSGLARQKRGGNFAAMAFRDVPAFVASQLTKDDASSRLAMLFAVLTAARSQEVRLATWDQIDLEARTWARPADIMKMKTPHVVTLSSAAVAILERAAPADMRAGLIFPGVRSGKPLSDMSLTRIMRLAGRSETVHGFRSAFRDWAAEMMPAVPAMVAEMALAHKVGTATEQAYLRSDLRDMRRALMDAWGRFAAPSLSGVADNIVALGAAKRSA